MFEPSDSSDSRMVTNQEKQNKSMSQYIVLVCNYRPNQIASKEKPGQNPI